MKKILIIAFAVFGYFTKDQQQDLFDNDWYLTMIVVDGEEFPTPPSDTHSAPPHQGEEISIEYFTIFFEGGGGFDTSGCNSISISIQDLDDSSFTVLGVGFTLIDCMYPLYDAHDGRYYHFFGAGQDEDFPLEGFLYEIINNSDHTKTLIITNPEGDKVYYNNSRLSTSEVTNSIDFQVAFQNENLIIKNRGSRAESVSIFDLNGKMLLSNSVSSEGIVSTAQLPKGIYIIRLTDEKGNVFSKKLRKN